MKARQQMAKEKKKFIEKEKLINHEQKKLLQSSKSLSTLKNQVDKRVQEQLGSKLSQQQDLIQYKMGLQKKLNECERQKEQFKCQIRCSEK